MGIAVIALSLSSIGGFYLGANYDYEAAPMVPIQETGRGQPQRPGTGANGLLTGP